MRESLIRIHLKKKAAENNWLHRPLSWTNRRDAPDVFIAKEGQIFLVETKAPGKDARASQIQEHRKLQAHEVNVIILDTKEKIDAFFQR